MDLKMRVSLQGNIVLTRKSFERKSTCVQELQLIRDTIQTRKLLVSFTVERWSP